MDYEITYELALGRDSYCELCGSTWNALTIEADDESWEVGVRTGCCGGDFSLYPYIDRAVSLIEETCAEFNRDSTEAVEILRREHLRLLKQI